MDKELYIIDTSFIPTAASTNRLFALGKSLASKGVKVSFIYLTPDSSKSKSDRYTDIFNFYYLWDGLFTTNKYICAIFGMLRLKKMMKPKIPVYVYSMLNFVSLIKKFKGNHVFLEYTENPYIIGRKNNFIGKWFYKKFTEAVPNLNGIFVITPSLKKLFVNSYGVDRNKIEILNMVADPNRFAGLESIEPSDEISYCGYISEFKDGVSILIQSFALFLKEHKNYKLNLIGEFVDKETRHNIEKLIKDLGITHSVNLLGAVSPSDIPLLLRKSKVLALARPDNEQSKYGFATKIGEYLFSERPAVITDVGDVKEYLTDGIDVVMAQPDNVVDFAAKLSWVVDNYSDSELIGKRGKKTALKLFNPTIEADKIFTKIFLQKNG